VKGENSVLDTQSLGPDELEKAIVLVHPSLCVVFIQQFGYPAGEPLYQA
jgi:hypothetical protein